MGALATILELAAQGWGRERILSTRVGQRVRGHFLGVDASAEPATLTLAEEDELWAVARAVLPSDVEPDAREAVLDRLRWRASSERGYASEFRRALEFLDREAARKAGSSSSWAMLSPTVARDLMQGLLEGIVAYRLASARAGTGFRLLVSPRFVDRYRLRRHLVDEILDSYYRSPLAWARLHYRSFPGSCAGFGVYSLPPDVMTSSKG